MIDYLFWFDLID